MAAPVRPVKFWRPGTEGPGVSISEERQSLTENSGTTIVYNPYAALSIEQQRQKLPVFKLRNHILYLIENYQTVVIVGETGCGKSTQIPQVAGRVAEERGAVLGHEVGYCIRFDDCTDPLATRIKFLTDGMLVREMMVDPLLTKYSVIMLDEAHERTLYTDIAIGLLKKIQKKRGDLRLIVASATLDAEVIVATNVAETSITISGIVYVIDCGFVKLRAYNPRTAIECLVVVPVSQASANQRAGRGGRNRSGKCYRLYTEEAFDKLPQSTVPEMQRSNLAPVILQLKALGIDNVLRFHFMSPPPAQSMVQALELLYALGGNFGCSQEILSIAAMMQIQNIFVVPSNQKSQAIRVHRKFAVEEGDHLTMLNVYEAFIKHNKNSQWCQEHFLNYKGLVRAATVREQLKKLLVKFQVPKKSSEEFFSFTRTIRDDHELHIHPASVLYAEKPPRWVIYNEVIQTSKYYMRDVTAIESAWLLELAPHFYQQGTHLSLKAKRAKVQDQASSTSSQGTFGCSAVGSSPSLAPPSRLSALTLLPGSWRNVCMGRHLLHCTRAERESCLEPNLSGSPEPFDPKFLHTGIRIGIQLQAGQGGGHQCRPMMTHPDSPAEVRNMY
ncbi:putative ATP-dependent RNA helicase DHX35 [Tupaia chinensis]|uniref:RNA helicase n=1 Tax=Tupaia chinensis TaxID=246437 RepID=L9L3X3_TUPCH|nr:putative ATP-dependent RNA helicase DHX35 [Tupaia chinensis]